MVQQETRDRIVTALIGAVAEKGWKGASLVAIAERAGISLAELRDAYESRGAMLSDFFGGIDRSVLEKRDPTMAAEVPLLCYGSLPGQERRNERFASRAGLALVARDRRDLARLLDRALRDPELLETLRERMRVYRRPDAARRIADLALRQVAERR